jgi:hypothetical protein
MTYYPVGAYGRLFPQQHIPVILLLIKRIPGSSAAGCPFLRYNFQVGETLRKQTATDREDRLTTRLSRRLIRAPSFRDGPLQIHLQPDIVNSDADPEINTSEGRLDLQVSCGLGYEVYFAIEAKRLRVSLPSRLFLGGREYVEDGMMRFVTGQYAPLMQSGAMLGYVFDGEKVKARSDINRQVQKKAKELKLKEPKRLAPSPILPDQPIDETHHNLERRSFTIYHLLLAV